MKTTITGKTFDEAGAGRAGWLRRWLGLAAEKPLRQRAWRRLTAIRRPWLTATLQARAAVVARTPLEDYLRARLARYLVRLPVSRTVLPVQVDVSGGEIIARRWTAPESAPPREPDAWASALVSLEGPSVLREVPELEARLVALDRERSAAVSRMEELSRRLEEDLAEGAIAPIPALEHSAQQLGRPPVRSPAPQLAVALLVTTVLLAQAWSIAVPALVASGQYPAALVGPFRPAMVEALFTCAFALGVAVGLAALALGGLASADAFARAVAPARRRRAQAAAMLAGVAAAAAAVAAASLPAPRSGLPPPGYAVLLLSVSGGVALLIRRARRWRDERAVQLAAALAWDRERARVLTERARRLEEVAWVKGLVAELDRRRERARRRLDHLAYRVAAASRLADATQQRIQRDCDRLAQSLVGALHRDRYEFLRQATARGATELLSGWKAPPEPRPAPAPELPLPETGRMTG